MEDDRRTERSKVTIRWMVTVVLFLGAVYLRRNEAIGTSWTVIFGLTAGVAVANLIFTAVLRHGAPRWLRYLTTATDLALTSILVAYSGGSDSPFYYVYFIILVSNSIRYGMGLAVFVALVYNVAYVAVLLAHPIGGDQTIEGVKILTFWGVALSPGYLATPFPR